MATTNEENWMMRYNEPKAYVMVCYHFPNKHKVEFLGLLNWANIPERKSRHVFTQKQRLLFKALEVSMNREHSMRRRKKILNKTMSKTG